MENRHVFTIWCDDIRQEIGNKPSFMGVYTGGIVLPALPMVLPRLGIWVWVTSGIDSPLQSFACRIQRDDGTILVNMPPTSRPNEEKSSNRPGATRAYLMAAMMIGPVEIPEGTKYFQAIVQTESEELFGPKLWIDVNPKALT